MSEIEKNSIFLLILQKNKESKLINTIISIFIVKTRRTKENKLKSIGKKFILDRAETIILKRIK